jgi:enamine deaminase RidA (YjgF/YER057c/UK114 family)
MLFSVLVAAVSAAANQPAFPMQAPYARAPENVVVPLQEEQRLEQEEWGYADAVIDGDHVWLSGVVAGLRRGETAADQGAAFDRAFQRIGEVLERSGAGFDGVVEMTTFHTDLPSQIVIFKQVKNRYIRSPFPAWTAVDVDRLLPDGGLVEIKIVARREPQIIQTPKSDI